MDSSISQDPFAPDDITGGASEPTSFREARFRAAGATEEEIAEFRVDFDELDAEEKASTNLIIDEADDAQMVEWVEQSRIEEVDWEGIEQEPGSEGEEEAEDGEKEEPDAETGDGHSVVDGETAGSEQAPEVVQPKSASTRKRSSKSS